MIMTNQNMAGRVGHVGHCQAVPSGVMSTVSQVVESLKPLTMRAAAWDKVGLQLGDPGAEVQTVGVCHEVTNEVIGQAADLDFLVTYHPLLFRPTTRLVAGSSPDGRAFRLLAQGTALYSVHTGWDAYEGGTADSLAASFGLLGVTGFGPLHEAGLVNVITYLPADNVEAVRTAMADAGGGVLGSYTNVSFETPGVGTFVPGTDAHPFRGEVGELYREPEVRLEMLTPRGRSAAVVAALLKSHPYEEPGIDVHRVVTKYGMVGRVGDLSQGVSLRTLAETAGTALGSDPVRIAGDREQIIDRVAVVPGSGSEFVTEARTEGAQVLISADFSHHNAVGATDAGLAVLDVGHARSEGPGMPPLYDWISKLGYPTRDLTGIETSPWKEQ